MTLTFSILYSFLNNTYFSNGNSTATCTIPAAMAAMVLASAAKAVTDNLAVIHPCSQVEKESTLPGSADTQQDRFGFLFRGIPATLAMHTGRPVNTLTKRKVAGYARVSTDSEEQFTSYEAQIDFYTQLIKNHEGWQFVEVYTDI